jgi:hypothetical protein
MRGLKSALSLGVLFALGLTASTLTTHPVIAAHDGAPITGSVLPTSPFTARPTPSAEVTSCCRLAETGSGGSAEGGEDANVAAWVIGLPGGGVQPPSGFTITDCTSWIFATDMPDIAGPNIAGGMRVDPDGVVAYLYQRDCGPELQRQYVWVRQESPASLARAAQENLRIRLLPAPIPQLSPASHSIVNFETWLAVQPVAPITVTADIPGMWLTVTAQVSGTVFDFDDGISVTCPVTGQIWHHHQPETRAPCGHTFRTFDPPGRGRVARIWLIWDVRWASSTGESGNLDRVDSAHRVVPHPVREIQTIGQRG